MKAVYHEFKENEENIEYISMTFKNSILEHFFESEDFYSMTLMDVEIKTDCFDIEIDNKNAIFDGIWVSHNGENYQLHAYFFPSMEAMETFGQKYLLIDLNEKDFKNIENYFLMEKRCLVG